MKLHVVHEAEFGDTSQENFPRVRSDEVQTLAVAEVFGGRKLDSQDI